MKIEVECPNCTGTAGMPQHVTTLDAPGRTTAFCQNDETDDPTTIRLFKPVGKLWVAQIIDSWCSCDCGKLTHLLLEDPPEEVSVWGRSEAAVRKLLISAMAEEGYASSNAKVGTVRPATALEIAKWDTEGLDPWLSPERHDNIVEYSGKWCLDTDGRLWMLTSLASGAIRGFLYEFVERELSKAEL